MLACPPGCGLFIKGGTPIEEGQGAPLLCLLILSPCPPGACRWATGRTRSRSLLCQLCPAWALASRASAPSPGNILATRSCTATVSRSTACAGDSVGFGGGSECIPGQPRPARCGLHAKRELPSAISGWRCSPALVSHEHKPETHPSPWPGPALHTLPQLSLPVPHPVQSWRMKTQAA